MNEKLVRCEKKVWNQYFTISGGLFLTHSAEFSIILLSYFSTGKIDEEQKSEDEDENEEDEDSEDNGEGEDNGESEDDGSVW